ncbi:uncharacterized protein LOC106478115 isoform X5 [Limulus polyphemus]|uniref:Uncharacterized protein LOC106478115 isoform X5 n=1 Tax=Limulus polyphemus TaxID=6850 RepID=A0ABM1S158_LIMPO|nr:uncharacterized protein LOC106478115 isoform X5 [Limulus polyphemus]
MWLCIKKTTVWKISVADRRRLYLKSTKEDSLKYSFYGSMNYQLHEANQEATGLVDFIFRALGIIGSSETIAMEVMLQEATICTIMQKL